MKEKKFIKRLRLGHKIINSYCQPNGILVETVSSPNKSFFDSPAFVTGRHIYMRASRNNFITEILISERMIEATNKKTFENICRYEAFKVIRDLTEKEVLE